MTSIPNLFDDLGRSERQELGVQKWVNNKLCGSLCWATGVGIDILATGALQFESLEDLINHASEKYLKYQGQINYLIGEDSDGNLHYYPSIAAFVRANGGSRSTISKHLDASREHPYQPKGAKMKLYTSDEYIPIKLKDAVPIEESLELLSGNIGKTPEKDNTEINSEIKESESSYSVGSETL